ncbi:hypothetical protein BJ875DRAFT_82128 [Amylocarpus encephaloides]|uniref:Adhesin domain-containing protein n=1 Tax=Amylocarpus encephaloides TaxID=45428 RepID=A0A9P8C3C6_9HELO|nr:hypothetical protein BJ875DRAFT_82128 [Amylocarpus encephaloides]
MVHFHGRPLSDNLYSADDSDGESFSDELTPSDGYFRPRELAPGAMVQDPTMDHDKGETPEDKTLIPTPHGQATSQRPLSASSHPAIAQASSSRTHASSPVPDESIVSSSQRYPTPQSRHPTPQSFPPHSGAMYLEQNRVNGPPPAYTPSPISTRYTPSSITSEASQDPQSPRRYSTFDDQPQLERGFLLPRTEPQSMGGPVDDFPDESTPLANERQDPCRRKGIKRALFCGVVFTVLIALFITFYQTRFNKPKMDLPSKDRPLDSTGPYCSSATIREDPTVYEFPVGTDLTVIQTTHDGDESRKSSRIKTWGEIRLRRLNSTVDPEHGDTPHFTVDVHISDPKLNVIRSWDEATKTLKISTPRRERLDTYGPHCVSLEITAWIPEDAQFTNLLLEAITLNLRVLDDVKVKVAGRSKFTSISGDVWFPLIQDSALEPSEKVARSQLPVILDNSNHPNLLANLSTPDTAHPFESRQIYIETISGAINGIFPLMDFLGLSSQSGDISVGVLPQKVSITAPAPADLEVQTASGNIQVNLPIANGGNPEYIPPPRNYITNVHSSAGSISGSYYVGSLGSFKNTAGNLKFSALPIILLSDSNKTAIASRFETHTVNGGTDAEVLEPIFISMLTSAQLPIQETTPTADPYDPVGDSEPYLTIPPSRALFKYSEGSSTRKLRTFQSKHSSNSASVSMVYPKVWVGSIHAKTISGDITVKGKGMRTIRDRKGIAFKEILARKGVEGPGEGSMAEMSDIAGNLRFELRDDV